MVTFIMSLMNGCTKKEESAQDSSSATGRYLEREITLPQEGEVLDVRVLDEGVIGALVTDQEESIRLWSTTDYGETWEMEYELPWEEDGYIIGATLVRDKTAMFISYNSAGKDSIWQIDSQGNKRQIELDLPEVEDGMMGEVVVMESGEAEGEGIVIEAEDGEMSDLDTGDIVTGDIVTAIRVSEEGKVIVLTMMDSLLQVDIETGEILKDYNLPAQSYTSGIEIMNGSIYLDTMAGIQRYDLETGDKQEINAVLSDYLNANNDNEMMTLESKMALTEKKGTTSELYLADNTGIYRQAEGGSVLEQVVSAELSSLANPSLNVLKLLALENDNFLVLGQSDGTWEHHLYYYEYSAEAKVNPATEIRIYALKDNRELRQAIALYQNANPEVFVSLEIGMAGDDGITVSDALNALNTEIMAGNGPDILVLDGMPIDSYIERGILEDISEMAGTGLVHTGDNTHAIATRFTMPYIVGKSGYIDKIEGIATLQEVSRAARNEFPDRKSMSANELEELITYLYTIDAHNFITQNEGVEIEKLRNFLQQVKEIATDSQIEDKEEELSFMAASGSTAFADTLVAVVNIATGEASIGHGEFKVQSDLAMLFGANEKLEDIRYKFLTDDAGENIVLANTILGVNSKSEQIEAAKEFLAFCLSKEAQMSAQGQGLPVNIEALRETLLADMDEMSVVVAEMGDDGSMKQVEIRGQQPTQEMVDAIEESLQSTVKVGYTNAIVQEIVIEQLMNYVEDRMTLDEAVEGINQKVSLYLAE